ncbi:MAG: hypothetical protein MI717_09745, partial [Spirochaetales bacterium]|nr:hypothetical protein [Spirochaetales bacterium]
TFWFKPESASKYKKFADHDKIVTIRPDGERVEFRSFLLSTPVGIIASDSSFRVYVNSRQINMFFKSKEKALGAAKMVCPKITPKAFYLYDYLEDQQAKEKISTKETRANYSYEPFN